MVRKRSKQKRHNGKPYTRTVYIAFIIDRTASKAPTKTTPTKKAKAKATTTPRATTKTIRTKAPTLPPVDSSPVRQAVGGRCAAKEPILRSPWQGVSAHTDQERLRVHPARETLRQTGETPHRSNPPRKTLGFPQALQEEICREVQEEIEAFPLQTRSYQHPLQENLDPCQQRQEIYKATAKDPE